MRPYEALHTKIYVLILFFNCYVIGFVPKTSTELTKTVNYVGVLEDGFGDLWKSNLEEVDTRMLEVEEGKIPAHINGIFVRNGPGLFEELGEGTRTYSHIFDGLAKIHAFDIGNGQVSFKSKFLRSRWYRKMVSDRGPMPPSITTGPVEPEFSAFEKIWAAVTSASLFDNVPVNVHQLGGSEGPIVATTDAPVMLEFDATSLRTVGRRKYQNSITSMNGIELFSTAHPLNRGDASYNYFFELKIGGRSKVHLARTNANGERTIIGSYKMPKGSLVPYVHSFSLTAKHAIVTLWPIYMNPAASVECKGFMQQLQWKGDSEGSTILVFDLPDEGDGVHRPSPLPPPPPAHIFASDALFAYHHINAFDTPDGHLVFDVTGYRELHIISGPNAFAYLPKMRALASGDESAATAQARDGTTFRFTLPLGTQKRFSTAEPTRVLAQELSAVGNIDGLPYTGELLTINEAWRGRHYRFAYGFTGFAGDDADRGGYRQWAIVKFDQKEGTAHVWREVGCFPSEATFVPDLEGSIGDPLDEDRGTLLSIVYDGQRRESFLLGLNAQTMTEVFRTYTGTRIPMSFHGQFFSR